jgi:hypothetical protein
LVALQRLTDCTAALRLPLPDRIIPPGAHDPAAIGAVGRPKLRTLATLQRFATAPGVARSRSDGKSG